MPTKTKAAAPGPRYEPSRRYSVQLARVVEYPAGSGRYLSPGVDALELRGDVANTLQAEILSAEILPELAEEA